MVGSLIIKPTKHEDFFLKYGTTELAPVRWGTRASFLNPEFQRPVLPFILDGAELTGAADSHAPIPQLSWDQKLLRIGSLVEGEAPGYVATVHREDLRAFCQSWDKRRRLFRPEEGIVTWVLPMEEVWTITPTSLES